MPATASLRQQRASELVSERERRGPVRWPPLLMDTSERLLGSWNLSMAGCGFRSVYHLGVLRCFLDHTPQLVHGASRVGGASSGCLVAAALAVGIPIGTHTHTHIHSFTHSLTHHQHSLSALDISGSSEHAQSDLWC